MSMKRPSEIDGILEKCTYDKAFAARVLSMGGRRFTVRFCCNAGRVHRVLVQQKSHDELLRKKDVVPLLKQIEDVVVDLEFTRVLQQFTGDKIDIEIVCRGLPGCGIAIDFPSILRRIK